MKRVSNGDLKIESDNALAKLIADSIHQFPVRLRTSGFRWRKEARKHARSGTLSLRVNETLKCIRRPDEGEKE